MLVLPKPSSGAVPCPVPFPVEGFCAWCLHWDIVPSHMLPRLSIASLWMHIPRAPETALPGRVQPGSLSAWRALSTNTSPEDAGTFCASFGAELGSARLRSALPAHVWNKRRGLTPKIAPSPPAVIGKGCFVPANGVGAASAPLALVSVVLGPSQPHPGAGHGQDGSADSGALCVTAGLLGDIWWHPLSDMVGCEAAGEPRQRWDEDAG